MSSVDDGVLTVPGETRCAEVEEAARPWLFASDRPDLTVADWIDRGGGDLLWELLGPTRAQVLGLLAELPDGRRVRFGGRVVKNVAGYDLSRLFCGARGELGRVVEAHLRLRPAPRGWRAAVRCGTECEEALTGPGCVVWTGDTWRFLRRGEAAPRGYEEREPREARVALREVWREVRSFRAAGEGVLLAGEGVLLAGVGVVGRRDETPPDRGPLWERLKGAWSSRT